MVRQVDNTIQKIRETLSEMWILVEGQLERAAEALLHNNKIVAHEVRNLEKMVDTYELMIDRECENFFALLNPVAVDMRLMISILKINNDLERIADFANGISKMVLDNNRDHIPDTLIKKLKIQEMFDEVRSMLSTCREAFVNESSSEASLVFAKDDIVDTIYKDAMEILTEYMKKTPDHIYNCLQLYGVIRRIERIGDRCSNIAEDIVFYLEAKVLKHQGNEK